jgi:hypothetical protein
MGGNLAGEDLFRFSKIIERTLNSLLRSMFVSHYFRYMEVFFPRKQIFPLIWRGIVYLNKKEKRQGNYKKGSFF